jgi:hypothetical protein
MTITSADKVKLTLVGLIEPYKAKAVIIAKAGPLFPFRGPVRHPDTGLDEGEIWIAPESDELTSEVRGGVRDEGPKSREFYSTLSSCGSWKTTRNLPQAVSEGEAARVPTRTSSKLWTTARNPRLLCSPKKC